MWDKIGLSQPNKTNIITWGLEERPTWQHPLDVLQ